MTRPGFWREIASGALAGVLFFGLWFSGYIIGSIHAWDACRAALAP